MANIPERKPKGMRALIFGGILPVILFTVIEEKYGTLWGLVAGMVFGLSEVAFEYTRYRKVETLTLAGNAMLLVLGSISLFTQNGIFFKLQPAIVEAIMGLGMLVSVVIKKPFLGIIAKKQGTVSEMPQEMAPVFESGLSMMTLRIGIFFLLHAVLATWAALYWSTRAWAILKGVGFMGSMIVYMIGEALYLRLRMHRAAMQLVAARKSEAVGMIPPSE